VFPDADLYLCEWHLKHALDRLLKQLCADEPDRRVDFELLRGRLDAAFTGPSFCRPFSADAHAVGSRRLSMREGVPRYRAYEAALGRCRRCPMRAW
jgi:hypothetical protein